MSAFEVRLWSDGERVSVLAKPAARPRVSADLLDSTLSVQDPVGLWEALTDALREDHGEHLAAYLTPPAVPTAPPRGAGVEGPGEAVEASPPARPVDTGLDGKTYARPEPRAPRRRALTDAFADRRWAAQKAVESLARLVEDDRFPQNAEKVATGNRSDLLRIKDQLELVIDALPHPGHCCMRDYPAEPYTGPLPCGHDLDFRARAARAQEATR